jgi:hypothetical protein
MPTATIKIFLVNGDPKKLRTAELSNWSGKAVAGPRSEFEGVVGREEAQQSGIYFLTGTDPETGKPAIYIGEAESIKDRIKSHLNRDFWNQIVFFVSKDENLTKAHIRFLEGRLIEQAREAKRAVVTNGQASGSKLPESDREDMEVFLEKMHQLLPVLGVELLVPTASKSEGATGRRELRCQLKGLQARGYLVPNGFLVLKGSEAVKTERPSTAKWPQPSILRAKLLEEGTLSERPDRLIFQTDVEFSSPSAAASVISGGSANGLTTWKDSGGRTLKEIQET